VSRELGDAAIRITVLRVALCGLLISCALAASAAARAPRGLWVLAEGSQRVLEHPERVALLLADAKALGVTDLFVQVHRGGRAWFASRYADAAPHLAAKAANGGVDALTSLIERADAQGLRVHAWVNVLNLAANAQAPILTELGRDAALVDHKGRSLLDYPEYEVPPPDRSYYRLGTPAIWLDPAAPGVAERLTATFGELAASYPKLAGIHLDYVRYADALPFVPGSRFGVGLSFGYGEKSRARFHAETKLVAPFGASTANADAWDAWRRAQLSSLVARISAAARAARPGIRVSAAVIPDPERALSVDLQDWRAWLDAGWLDFAAPMLYTRDAQRFAYGVEIFEAYARKRALWVGIGAWLFARDPAGAKAQLAHLAASRRLGSALFSWDALRERPELLSALATAQHAAQAAAEP
jgi:uncharacterized lipoprotein YddW (UPF0748 family)